jgi:ABC-type phosphate transport system auxiliary subunit
MNERIKELKELKEQLGSYKKTYELNMAFQNELVAELSALRKRVAVLEEELESTKSVPNPKAGFRGLTFEKSLQMFDPMYKGKK